MATASVQTQMKITLELTAEEALFIKAFCQNPTPTMLSVVSESIFDALPTFPDLEAACRPR